MSCLCVFVTEYAIIISNPFLHDSVLIFITCSGGNESYHAKVILPPSFLVFGGRLLMMASLERRFPYSVSVLMTQRPFYTSASHAMGAATQQRPGKNHGPSFLAPIQFEADWWGNMNESLFCMQSKSKLANENWETSSNFKCTRLSEQYNNKLN